MTATLDLNTLSEPLRAVFQSVVGECETFRTERDNIQKLQAATEAERRRLALENKLLQEAIRLLRLEKYGAKNEQLSDAQLALLDLEPGVAAAEVAGEMTRPASEKKMVRKAAAHGRGALPAHLPRVEEIILVPADQRHCATCHCPKCAMGFDVAEVLDLKPAELFVRVINAKSWPARRILKTA